MSESNIDPQTLEPQGVQHDSETPLPQKPSVLFILSALLGISGIVFLSISIYQGLAPQ